MSTPTRWRLLVTAPATGPENMALDEALMDRARDTSAARDEWVLRVYGWRNPTLSLGRNQRAVDSYDRERLAAYPIDVVRRPTGGRAILHYREATYSVTGPVSSAGDLRETFARINRVLIRALESFGVGAAAFEANRRAPAPGAAPCFAEPSPGELTVEGKKLVGSAQWRSEGAFLQHGSILVEDDQQLLRSFTRPNVAGDPAPVAPATLAGLIGRAPSLDEVAAALGRAVRDCEDAGATELVLEPEVRARASGLVVRYLDDAWTWRR